MRASSISAALRALTAEPDHVAAYTSPEQPWRRPDDRSPPRAEVFRHEPAHAPILTGEVPARESSHA